MSGLETIALAAGTGLSAFGTIAGGMAAKNNADAKAAEMQRKAMEERAIATRDAVKARKEAETITSQQLARGAASGGSATDATMLDIFADTEAQAEYNKASALYRGESNARNLEAGAQNARQEGRAKLASSYISAAGTVLSDVSKSGKSYRKLFD